MWLAITNSEMQKKKQDFVQCGSSEQGTPQPNDDLSVHFLEDELDTEFWHKVIILMVDRITRVFDENLRLTVKPFLQMRPRLTNVLVESNNNINNKTTWMEKKASPDGLWLRECQHHGCCDNPSLKAENVTFIVIYKFRYVKSGVEVFRGMALLVKCMSKD